MGAFLPAGEEWQLTVYSADFKTPDFVKGGVISQIFPDRFCNSGEAKKAVPEGRVLRDDWGGVPEWRPDSKGEILNNDYFDGDLRGIESKLEYIASLGVTLIYLNPIFEAHSNHRYDTADYMRIDPLLGTREDFERLCSAAKKLGIGIVLDGVFSHTGADSIYFNKNNRYDSVGAYNSCNSKYFSWYNFRHWNDDYACWWNILTLPEVDEEDASYTEFITGDSGVIKTWLSAGAAGFRLDVADELPDSFIDELYSCVKGFDSEKYLIGEVWEDASNKISHGGRRRYLLGGQMDSVMNYPFADAITDFVHDGLAEVFMERIVTIAENYPPAALNAAMNHIGTHDTARAITRFVFEELEERTREQQSGFVLDEEQYALGKRLLKFASALQYTLPGIPSLYYGDEAGMQGGKDPFNRGCFPWGNEDAELTEWYRLLGKIRRENPCLADGEFSPVSAMLGCVAYARIGKAERMLLIANHNNHPITYDLPAQWHNSAELIRDEDVGMSVEVDATGVVILIKKENQI